MNPSLGDPRLPALAATRTLRPPAVVRAATDAYLRDEDVLETWLGECVAREPTTFSSTTSLHVSYHSGAERTGERFYGLKRFGQLLEERGFQRERTARANGFRGLKLVGDAQLELVNK